MLNENLAMDRNVLLYIARLPQREELLIKALSGDDRVLIPELVQRFGVEDVLREVKDQPLMASLLYFFGILTLAGERALLAKLLLGIPNLVAREFYMERLRKRWLPASPQREVGQRAALTMHLRADPTPLCDFIEAGYDE
jgi:hypothetical protein